MIRSQKDIQFLLVPIYTEAVPDAASMSAIGAPMQGPRLRMGENGDSKKDECLVIAPMPTREHMCTLPVGEFHGFRI